MLKKWSNTRKKSCSKCWKIFHVCCTIFWTLGVIEELKSKNWTIYLSLLSREQTWKQLVKKQVFSAYNLSGEASLKIDAFPCFTKCQIFKYLYKQLICSSIHPKELVKLLPKHSMQPKKKSCSHAFMLEMPTCTSLKALKSLKLVSIIFYQIFIFSPNDSPSKTMKYVFYFI